MNCRDAVVLLEQRPLGLLDPSQTAELDDHLTSCADCRAEAEALDLVHAELSTQGAPMSLPASLRDRVVDAMDGVYTEDALAAKSKGLIVAEAEVDPERVAAAAAKISLACSYCHDRTQRAELVFCASCLAPHHAECFAEHGRCSLAGCEEQLTVRPGGDAAPRARRHRWRGGLLLGAIAVGLPAAALFGFKRYEVASEQREARAEFEDTLAQRERLRAQTAKLEAEAKREWLTIASDPELATREQQILHLAVTRIDRYVGDRDGRFDVDEVPGGIRLTVELPGKLDAVGTRMLATLREALRSDRELATLVELEGLTEARLGNLEPPTVTAELRLAVSPTAEAAMTLPVPPGQVSSGPARLSFAWQDAPLDVVLAKLQEVADRELLLRVDDQPLPTVTLPLEGMPWDRVLDLVVEQAAYRVEPRADGALLITQPPRVKVGFRDAKLVDVIGLLAAYSGKNVMLGAGVEGTCTLDFDRVPWDEALLAVADANGLQVGAIGDVLLVTDGPLPDDATPLFRYAEGWWVKTERRADGNGNLVVDPRFDLRLDEAPLGEVIARIQAHAPRRLELRSGEDRRHGALALEQVTWDEALAVVCDVARLWSDDHPDVVSLRPRESNLLRASGIDIHTWFTVLAQRAGVSLVVPGHLQGRVSTDLSGVSYRDALVATASALGLEVRRGRHDLYELHGTLALEEGGPKPTAEQLVIDGQAITRLEAVVLSPSGKLAILSGKAHEIGDELVDQEQLTRPTFRITAIDGQKVEITQSGPGEPKVHFVKFR